MFKYLFLGITCVLSVQLHAQQIYKWVDKNGNVTYSRKQPPKGAKQQNIETIRSLGTSNTSTPKQTYRSNSSIPNTYVNHYQGTHHNTYTIPRQPTRSAEEEALRQKIIKEASTPYAGSKNGQLTANQRRTLAAVAGADVPSDNYSSPNNPFPSVPKPPTPQPTHMTSCDSSGCWDNQGNRYKGNNGTYFSNGQMCRDIGGRIQCN